MYIVQVRKGVRLFEVAASVESIHPLLRLLESHPEVEYYSVFSTGGVVLPLALGYTYEQTKKWRVGDNPLL